MEAFQSWKEREEENTYYFNYVKVQATYQRRTMKGIGIVQLLKSNNNKMSFIAREVIHKYYHVCCRDGQYKENEKPRMTKAKQQNQRSSRKLNSTCASCLYFNKFYDGHVTVTYISEHASHDLVVCELPHLSVPPSVKNTVAIKTTQVLAHLLIE